MSCILITGATGAIGSALVPLFLREESTTVRLVLRAGSPGQLQERLRQLFAFWEMDWQEIPASRLEAYAGDVTLPLLGLDSDVYGRLAGEVTHVIHAAGNVKLNQSLDAARKSAVSSAAHVVAFCRSCLRAGPFRKLDFVSTVGVAGRTHGRVPEEPLRQPRAFHNTYEAAKAEAEDYLLGEMRSGLAATIHRPSMVVGDSRTGQIIHFQVFYFLSELLCGMKTWGVVPHTGAVRLDIIPVDYVAAALHLASGSAETAGRVFHLCAGPDHAPGLSQLIPRLRHVFACHGRHLPRLHRVRPGLVRALLPLATSLSPAGFRRALQGLPYFLAYLDEEQLFENDRTREFLAGHGLSIPRVDQYLERVLHYYCTQKQAQRPPRPVA
jgi:thioester reductase-like protein